MRSMEAYLIERGKDILFELARWGVEQALEEAGLRISQNSTFYPLTNFLVSDTTRV